ncbi:MAG TPA: type II secretion system protein N [Usitatibacter sp.]|nr:type II secretion system protein N [Usitatibacter sp.]
MRAPALVALGMAAYGVFLVATMPATFVASQAEARARGTLRVHEAHGTVWHGAARVDVAVGPAWLPLDSVAWRLLPRELLSGRLAFAVDAQAAGGTGKGTLARGFTGWHARGQASAPAAVAANVVPLLSTWRPEGRIDVRSDGIAWDGSEAQGELVAEWRDAAVALSQVRPLGAYRATLRAEGANAKLAVTTLDGPLRIAGQGEAAWPSRFTFNGEARAEGPDARALDPLLDLLGPRRADGARTLAWRMN